MGILKGYINCKSDEHIPSNSILKIHILHIVDNELKKSKLIKNIEIANPTQFPVSFQVDFVGEPLIPGNTTFYFLRAHIERDGEILFKNFGVLETGFYGDLVGRNDKYRKHLDVYLTFVPSSAISIANAARPTSKMMSNSLTNIIQMNKIKV